jgi:hypothetical protein
MHLQSPRNADIAGNRSAASVYHLKPHHYAWIKTAELLLRHEHIVPVSTALDPAVATKYAANRAMGKSAR